MDDYKNFFNLIKNKKTDLFINEINKLPENFDLSIKDETNNYLINYAIIHNDIKSVKLLLDRKVSIDIFDFYGKSILYIPINFQYIEIIKLILSYNKKITGISILDIKDKFGDTAIFYAITNKNVQITNLLLNNNANPNMENINKYNALHYAIQMRSLEICKILIPHMDNINAVTSIGESALHIAANLQLEQIVLLLLKNGIDLNLQQFNNEFTALHYIAINNNINIGKILIEHNIDCNLQDSHGNTILHIALINNNISLIKLILTKENINYNTWNIDQMYPLHIILYNIDLFNKIKDNLGDEMIKQIIYNSNVSIKDINGNTCLFLLCKNNLWKNYIDVLNKKKLDIFLINNNNERIIDTINKNDYDTFINLITSGYIYVLKRSSGLWTDELDLMCSYEFKNIPSSVISELKKTYKVKNDIMYNKTCFNLIKKKITDNIDNKITSYSNKFSVPTNVTVIHSDNNVQFCTYTGSTLDILIGLIYLLKKHNKICSTINFGKIKNMEVCDFYKSKGFIINSKCEALHFELLWIYPKLYIIDNFAELIKKCIYKKSKYIIIPLGIDLDNGSHANYIIYDVHNITVERFEPHGSTFPIGFNYYPDILDNELEKIFVNIDNRCIYIRPKQFIPKIGFQTLDVIDSQNKQIGDPGGFCALWSVWYVDMRLTYRFFDKIELIDRLIRYIKYNNLSFKNVIRNYGKNITELRDEILSKINLNINQWSNDIITNTQIDNFIKEIFNILSNI